MSLLPCHHAFISWNRSELCEPCRDPGRDHNNLSAWGSDCHPDRGSDLMKKRWQSLWGHWATWNQSPGRGGCWLVCFSAADLSKTATNNTKKVSSDNLALSLSSSSFGSSAANWTSKAKATLTPFAKRHRNTGETHESSHSMKVCSLSSVCFLWWSLPADWRLEWELWQPTVMSWNATDKCTYSHSDTSLMWSVRPGLA